MSVVGFTRIIEFKQLGQSREPNPEHPIAGEEAGSTGALAPQDRQLMPERDNLQFQRDAVAKPKGQQGKYGRSHRVHAGDHIGVEPITRSYVSVIDFAIGTGI